MPTHAHIHTNISNAHEVNETTQELKIIYTFLQVIYAVPLANIHAHQTPTADF